MLETSETDPIPKNIQEWILSEIRAKTCPYRDFFVSVRTAQRIALAILALGEVAIAFLILLKG